MAWHDLPAANTILHKATGKTASISTWHVTIDPTRLDSYITTLEDSTRRIVTPIRSHDGDWGGFLVSL